MYEWAHFRRAKGAVKLRLRLDHNGYLPDNAVITDGKCHEIRAAHQFSYDKGSITVFDKAYVDFSLFHQINDNGAYFVTRLKSNADFSVVKKMDVPWNNTVISDALVKFQGVNTKKKYPGLLRIVKYYDEENDRMLYFPTNNFKFAASTIAAIYKERWAIENFLNSSNSI